MLSWLPLLHCDRQTDRETERQTVAVFTCLLWYFNAPFVGAVVSSLVAPAWSPLLRRIVPNHPTSLALDDALHTRVLLPASRLLWCRNLPR